MYDLIKFNPDDTLLFSIGEDINIDTYKDIIENLKHLLHTENIIIYPENMIKNISVLRKEGCCYPNMFLGDKNDYLY